MTVDLMEDWMKSVWERRPGALRNTLKTSDDAFHGNLSEEKKNKL
jgi:hypothetical protein